MASEIETIADIEAEMRNWDTHSHLDSHAHDELCAYADRIEAAWKREAVTNCNGSGNAAAMREALEKIRRNLTATYHSEEEAHNLIVDAFNIAGDALAAPPRNCDKYSDKNHARARYNQQSETPDPFEWLYAPAEKGGAE